MRAVAVAVVACWIGDSCRAQQSYGEDYAFAERPPANPLEELVARTLPSVVKVHGASGLATIDAYASGVVVSEQGHVLTLDLVMIQRGQTRVVLADGSVHQAEVYPSDTRLGVRMLKIDAGDKVLRPLRLPARNDHRHGTFLVSIGNSFRLAEFSEKLSVTFGLLTARARTGLRYRLSDVDYDGELLLTDAPNNPGHYGGALVTTAGDWVGLNTRLLESRETNTQLSAAIPTADLAAYIARFTEPTSVADEDAEQSKPPPVYHGIRLFDEGLRRSPPAYVERVERDSPGRAVGLRADDLIVRVDDFPVRTCAEFRRVMAKFAPGDTVQVTFKRGRRVLREAMTLEEGR